MTDAPRDRRFADVRLREAEPTRRSRQLPETVTAVDWRECWLNEPDRFTFIELLGTESLRSRLASDPPVRIAGGRRL